MSHTCACGTPPHSPAPPRAELGHCQGRVSSPSCALVRGHAANLQRAGQGVTRGLLPRSQSILPSCPDLKKKKRQAGTRKSATRKFCGFSQLPPREADRPDTPKSHKGRPVPPWGGGVGSRAPLGWGAREQGGGPSLGSVITNRQEDRTKTHHITTFIACRENQRACTRRELGQDRQKCEWGQVGPRAPHSQREGGPRPRRPDKE